LLETAALGIPFILCGYDGLKNFVTLENIELLAECNFSGRNIANVPFEIIEQKFIELYTDQTGFILDSWIIANRSLDSIGDQYIADIVELVNEIPGSNWADSLIRLCKNQTSADVFSPSLINLWFENINLGYSKEILSLFSISTEIQKLAEENKILLQELSMTKQHLHDLGVYKDLYEKELKEEIATLKEERDKNRAVITSLEKERESYRAENEKLQSAYSSMLEKFNTELYENIDHRLNLILEKVISNRTSFESISQENIAQYKNEIENLKNMLNALREEKNNLERVRNEISIKLHELSHTKFFKYLNALRRFKHQFLRGSSQDKRNFIKWFSYKLVGKNFSSGYNYSPFIELWRILDGNGANSNTIPENKEGIDRFEVSFQIEYNNRFQYYKNFLNSEIPQESHEIMRILKNRTFKGIVVYPEAIHWEPVQRPQQFLRELASRGYLCFFCYASNGPFEMQEIEPNLITVNKEAFLLPVLRSQACIVLCSWLVQMAWADLIPHKLVWYDVLDQIEFFSLNDQDMNDKHRSLLKEADIISYSSKKLLKYVEERKDALYLPNGVKLDDFAKLIDGDIPEEIQPLLGKGPILGYFGAVEEWFDVELINHLAERNADWQFVIIGKIGVPQKYFSGKNIHLLGPKPYHSLGNYAKKFDIALIPFKVNELTNCVSPVKFFEYQAMGLPVISAPIEEMKQYEGRFVKLASTVEEFESAAANLMSGKKEEIHEYCLELARKNQWSVRIDAVEQFILKNPRNWFIYGNIFPSNRVAVMASTFLGYDGDNFYSGGAERYLLDLNQVCASMGVPLTIFQYGNYPWMRRFKNLDVVSLSRGGHNTEVFSLECVRKFNRLFYEQIAERSLVNIYSAFFEAWTLAASPSIGISHGVAWDSPSNHFESGSHFWETNRRFIEGGKVCDMLVSVDTNTANWFQTIDYTIGHKVKVVPNYVDLEEFKPRNDFIQEREKIVIVYPRRLYEARGLYIVLDIIDNILSKYPFVEFHFVGKGFEQDTVHVQKKQEQWPGKVKWYWLDPDDMPNAYKEADIALIPTLYSEGTSLSCLEAMASGNAVIATRIGGLTDLVINNYNGFLIDPDSHSLEKSIEDLLLDRNKLTDFKKRGLAVAAAFSKKQWLEKWKDILQPIIPNDILPEKNAGKLIELYLENEEILSKLGRFVSRRLNMGDLIYIYIKNKEADKTLSFGRIQFLDWKSERLAEPDFVLAEDKLLDEISLKVDQVITDEWLQSMV
jgi:glycosyltransferase involved in cell wall biosynthesis